MFPLSDKKCNEYRVFPDNAAHTVENIELMYR